MHYCGFSGLLAIGSANFAYYRSMGVPSALIFRVSYTVDNLHFITAGKAARIDRAKVRAMLGMDPDFPAIIYVLKFDRYKRL